MIKDSVAFIATLPADATGSVVFSSTNGADQHEHRERRHRHQSVHHEPAARDECHHRRLSGRRQLSRQHQHP